MPDKMTIVVGDYTAKDSDSYLAKLDRLSEQRQDGGLLHGGHIHFIQEKMGWPFLKAAISMILERVPSVFPYDLPELVERGTVSEVSPSQEAAMREMNSNLLVPIDGYDVLRVISLAREYEGGD